MAAMAAMATDTMLTTAPASFTILRRPQWRPSSRIIPTCLGTFNPRALRVSCCANPTPTTVKRIEEPPSGDDGGSSTNSGRGFGEVYVVSVPLRAPPGAAQVFDLMKDLEICANFQHYMTIIKPNDDGSPEPCTVLDFQPQNPEDPLTAVAVLMGNSIPGVILERTLSKLPKQRCWWVGDMKPGLSLEDALAFSRGYNSELSLGINDCRHHTLDLVEYLTGKSMSHIEQVRKVRELAKLLEDELENSSEESPNVDSVEKSVKDMSSVKESVSYRCLVYRRTSLELPICFHFLKYSRELLLRMLKKESLYHKKECLTPCLQVEYNFEPVKAPQSSQPLSSQVSKTLL